MQVGRYNSNQDCLRINGVFHGYICGTRGINMTIKQGIWTIYAELRSPVQIQLDSEQQLEIVIGAL